MLDFFKQGYTHKNTGLLLNNLFADGNRMAKLIELIDGLLYLHEEK